MTKLRQIPMPDGTEQNPLRKRELVEEYRQRLRDLRQSVQNQINAFFSGGSRINDGGDMEFLVEKYSGKIGYFAAQAGGLVLEANLECADSANPPIIVRFIFPEIVLPGSNSLAVFAPVLRTLKVGDRISFSGYFRRYASNPCTWFPCADFLRPAAGNPQSWNAPSQRVDIRASSIEKL